MGTKPGLAEDLDPTPPMPFFEDPDPTPDPSHVAPDPGPEPGPDPELEDWEPPTQEQWEAEQARISTAEENARVARELADQNRTMMTEILGSQRQPAVEEVADPGPMPDPVRDPEGFGTWLGQRDKHAEAKFNKTLGAMQADLQQNARANDLFTQFVSKHPDMADKRDIVELASRRAGLRPTDSKEMIFSKVIEQLTVLGIPVDVKPEGDPPPRRRGGRAAGLGGGSGPRRRRREPAEEKPVDLVDQISADQARLGVY